MQVFIMRNLIRLMKVYEELSGDACKCSRPSPKRLTAAREVCSSLWLPEVV